MYCYLIAVTVQLRTALDVGFASIAKSDRGGMDTSYKLAPAWVALIKNNTYLQLSTLVCSCEILS